MECKCGKDVKLTGCRHMVGFPCCCRCARRLQKRDTDKE